MLGIIYILILFAPALESRIPYINYWDEACILVLVFFAVAKQRRGIFKCEKETIIQWILLFALAILGLAGNVLHSGIQGNILAVIKDLIAFLKFPVAVLLLPYVFETRTDKSLEIVQISKGLLMIMAISACVGYFVDLGMYLDDSFRLIKSFKFIFSHPTFLVSAIVFVLAILLADSMEKHRNYLILGCALLFLTQRSKAYFAIAAVLFILILGEERLKKFLRFSIHGIRIRKKYIVAAALILGVAGWVLAKDKVAYYFSYGLTAARPALYLVGLRIVRDFFPIGSGFGTFASSLSGEYYSSLYGNYGISGVMGLTQTDYSYMADVFWPYIYGQLGVLGLVGYALLLVLMLRSHLMKVRHFSYVLSIGFVWLYALFASTAEAYFTNSTAIQMAFILYVFIGFERKGSIEYKYEK